MRQEKYQEAESMLVVGYETLRDASGPVAAALKRLVEFYEATNKEATAQKYVALLEMADG